MKVSLIFCLAFLVQLAYSQQITITGKVVDIATKEPLPFASIGILGKPIGLISNEQGEFDFHIPAEMRNDILVISMLGYKTITRRVVYTNYERPKPVFCGLLHCRHGCRRPCSRLRVFRLAGSRRVQ